MKNILLENPNCDIDNFRKYLLKFLGNENVKGKRILDLGCGYGWCEKSLLLKGAKEIVGVDISISDIEIAKKLKNKSLHFYVASATKLPFKYSSFDTVVCWEVLEHLVRGTENLLFKEVHRVLKPGGYLFLSTPNKNILVSILDPAWWTVKHRNYSKDQIINFASSTGFKIKDLQIQRVYRESGLDWMMI